MTTLATTITFQVDTLSFFQALDAGKHAISADITHDGLNCMLFEYSYNDGKLSLIGLDGHCFFKTDLMTSHDVAECETHSFLLHKKDIEQIQAMVKHKKGWVEFAIDCKSITIKAQYEATFTPVKYSFPDYQLFLSKTDDYSEQAFNFQGFNAKIFAQVSKVTKYMASFTMGMGKDNAEQPVINIGKPPALLGD